MQQGSSTKRSAFLRVILPLAASLVSVIFPIASAFAEESYWLQKGGQKIGKCASSSDGVPLQIASNASQWILVTGVLTCKAVGLSYLFELNWLRVEINPARRDDIVRDALNFDWIGLAVYKPEHGGETIQWLYDEAFPIRGTLKKDDTKKIYFGRVTFVVSKADIATATRFTLYITSEGPLYNFGLL
jgi:hypothetical protein